MRADMADTVELDRVRVPVRDGGRAAPRPWEGLAGALGIGLLTLGIVLLAVEVFAPELNVRGPGAGVIAGHLAGGAVSLGGAVGATRSPTAMSLLLSLVAGVVAMGTLWIFWWA